MIEQHIRLRTGQQVLNCEHLTGDRLASFLALLMGQQIQSWQSSMHSFAPEANWGQWDPFVQAVASRPFCKAVNQHWRYLMGCSRYFLGGRRTDKCVAAGVIQCLQRAHVQQIHLPQYVYLPSLPGRWPSVAIIIPWGGPWDNDGAQGSNLTTWHAVLPCLSTRVSNCYSWNDTALLAFFRFWHVYSFG